jgi:hypothetical protein
MILRIMACVVFFQSCTAAAESAHTDSGLVRQGRWLYYGGKPQWIAGIDFQSAAARRNYDYELLLDRLKESGLNKVRLWAYPWFMGPQSLSPWKYTHGKYDLNQWDPAYWKRLRRFVREAEVRDIFVEFTVFAPYPSRLNPPWWTNDDYRLAWNRSYNRNGAFTTNSSGHFYPEFFSLIHPEQSGSGNTLFGYQRALVDKVLSELGTRPNVFFEIANEFPADFESRGQLSESVHWALYWSRYMKNRTSRPIAVHAHDSSGAHLRGLEHYRDKPYIDVLNFHFYSRQPNDVFDLLGRAAYPAKVLQLNESHAYMADQEQWYSAIRESWSAFIGGTYYHYHHSDSYADAIHDPLWSARLASLAFLRNVAESQRFWELSPYDAAGRSLKESILLRHSNLKHLVTGKPASTYVVYIWPGRSAQQTSDALPCGELELNLPEGSYDAQWYDPRDGSLLREAAGLKAAGLSDVPCAYGGPEETGYVLILRRSNSADRMPQ